MMSNMRKLFYTFINANHSNCVFSSARYRSLYSASSLGMDKFEVFRNTTIHKYGNSKKVFIDKMNQLCDNQSKKYVIIDEELKDMMYMCNKTDEELDLLMKMAKSYNSLNNQTRPSKFVFGPQFMRLFYLLKTPNHAKQAFNELGDFFNQVSSYFVYMTLLYDTNHYQDVIEAMKKMIESRISLNIVHNNSFLLAMASCYKLNSPESLQTAQTLLNKAYEIGSKLDSRAIAFVSALALRNDSPHIAVELFGRLSPFPSFAMKNIKIKALTELDRLDDCMPILRGHVDVETRFQPEDNAGFLKSIISSLEDSLTEKGNDEDLSEFRRVKEQLNQKSLIIDMTLDSILCTPIELSHKNDLFPGKTSQREKRRAMMSASFNRNNQLKRQDRRF